MPEDLVFGFGIAQHNSGPRDARMQFWRERERERPDSRTKHFSHPRKPHNIWGANRPGGLTSRPCPGEEEEEREREDTPNTGETSTDGQPRVSTVFYLMVQVFFLSAWGGARTTFLTSHERQPTRSSAWTEDLAARTAGGGGGAQGSPSSKPVASKQARSPKNLGSC